MQPIGCQLDSSGLAHQELKKHFLMLHKNISFHSSIPSISLLLQQNQIKYQATKEAFPCSQPFPTAQQDHLSSYLDWQRENYLHQLVKHNKS